MTKRRINKQQSARIEKIQQSFQTVSSEGVLEGLVLIRFGKQAELEDKDGNIVRCAIRPHVETLVAGDKVLWQAEGPGHGVILSLCPRTSVLSRLARHGERKPVAANISQMIIVAAPKPEISWPLLDSYLIMAESLQLKALILLNKTDLPCESLKSQLMEEYSPLGYEIILASKNDPHCYNALAKALNNELSVFIGQSGVGKSSLISAVLPHEEHIITQAISENSELGRHTTSNSRFYHLPSGGALIDSPGVREFSLWDLGLSEIAQGYKEFKPYLYQCKFRNCPHIDTPHCAIIHAVNKGIISKNRYGNFINLCQQQKNK